MKLVDFDLAAGGTIAINPEQVAGVMGRPDGKTIIRLVGRSEDIYVMEDFGDVTRALLDGG